jgi:putative ABC transport system permease protein
MTDPQLIKYIEQTFKAGFKKQEIKDALAKAKWPENLIEEGFFEVHRFFENASINSQRLVIYLTKTLQLGFGKEQIKKSLMDSNWPEREIDAAFLKIPASPPKPQIMIQKIIPQEKKPQIAKTDISKSVPLAAQIKQPSITEPKSGKLLSPESQKKPLLLPKPQVAKPPKPERRPRPDIFKKFSNWIKTWQTRQKTKWLLKNAVLPGAKKEIPPVNLPIADLKSDLAPLKKAPTPPIKKAIPPAQKGPAPLPPKNIPIPSLLTQKTQPAQKIQAVAKISEPKDNAEPKKQTPAKENRPNEPEIPKPLPGGILGVLKAIVLALTFVFSVMVLIIFTVVVVFFSGIIYFFKLLAAGFIKIAKLLALIARFLLKIVIFPFKLMTRPFRAIFISNGMKFIDTIRLAGRMFKTRRLRTLLTILGISIGIGTILFLVSLGYGLQNMLLQQITSSDALLSIDVTSGGNQTIPLDRTAIDKFKQLPNVVEVSPMASFPAQILMKNVEGRDLAANTLVNAVTPAFFRLAGIKVSAGEFFAEPNQNRVVVSEAVIKLFNLDEKSILDKEVTFTLFVPTGADPEAPEETITIERKDVYKIVGIIGDPENNYIYIPLDTLSDLTITDFSVAKVKVTQEQYLTPTREAILNLGYSTSALSDTITEAKKIFSIVQIVLAIFGIIALFVSAIGMFNTITIALLERTQEIGIMKSLGASNRDIWKLFLTESIIMGFMGGIGGLVTSYVGATLFNYGVNFLARSFGGQSVDLFQRPLWFILTIVIFSTLVGFIVGLWPARRAARINPLEALRYK